MRIFSVFAAAGMLLNMVAPVLGDPLVVGYYATWKKAQTEGVDFSKYTHINIAFAIPNADGTFTLDESFALPEAVTMIRGKGAKVLISIGGWTGSNLISAIMSDDTTNKKFLTSIVDYVKTNDLDGVDLDWEYPGKSGAKCNPFDEANDTPNYLKFLQALRSELDTTFGEKKKLITMAVYVAPFYVNGAPSTDVSEFAKVVDYAHLMQYDVNGGWLNLTGPNAPLNNDKENGAPFSFASAIDAWTGAKWPANQLTAGLAFYGRSTTTLEDMTKTPDNMYQNQSNVLPQGDSEDAVWADTCDETDGFNGQWQWKHLRDQKVLTDPLTAAAPWVRTVDKTSNTPWLFNPEKKTFISYDDPDSIEAKINYAASKGLAGAMVWAIYMDYNGELLDTVHKWPSNGASIGGGTDSSSSEGDGNLNEDNASSSSSDGGGNLNEDNASSSSSNGDDNLNDDDTSSSSYEAVSISADKNVDFHVQDHSSSSTGGEDNLNEDNKSSSSAVEDNLNEANNDTDNNNAGSGGSCSTDGGLTCKDSGNSEEYFVCVYGDKVTLSCSPGTVCVDNAGSILCDWAKNGSEGGGASEESSSTTEDE